MASNVLIIDDGTNNAPALARADVGIAMNSGTQAAKEAGNMVDLDNDPTKLIEVVDTGKQLLMTRGTLTTFSVANDVDKYFAIVPALLIASIPGLQSISIMRLHSPESAILSAVIFNAIIPMLIPLALKGVAYKPIGANAWLRQHASLLCCQPQQRHRCAIPAAHIRVVFPGVWLKGKGTGIGLSVSKHFAEAQGGTIWVKSEPSKGSGFTLKLPLS